MTSFILLLLAATPLPDGGEVLNVAPDGGVVRTLVPEATPGAAVLLAPELVPGPNEVVNLTPPSLSVYKVNFPAEAALTGGALGLALVIDLMVKPTLEGDVSCRQHVGNGRCNPADLWAVDRYAVGKVSKPWGLFSDVALYSSIALPVIYLGIESLVLPTNTPLRDWVGDLLVISEAMALTGVGQTVMKFAFRRPRPARYVEVDAATSSFDQELSFPSGHASMVAAATTALATTVFLRHPKSPVRFVLLAACVLLTVGTSFARVESGQHFPTDVIIGSMIGGFSGFIVPWLHKRRASPLVRPIAGFDPVTGASKIGVGGTF